MYVIIPPDHHPLPREYTGPTISSCGGPVPGPARAVPAACCGQGTGSDGISLQRYLRFKLQVALTYELIVSVKYFPIIG